MTAYLRAIELLRPYTNQHAVPTDGVFAVDDTNTYNTVIDSRNNPNRLLQTVYKLNRVELDANPEVLDAIIDLVEGMRPNEVIVTAASLKKSHQ